MSRFHPHALVESQEIGEGTRVWAFAHVCAGVVIGIDCNIGDHCFIESGVTLGDRVTVKNGVSLWSGVTVENDVFIGPNVAFVNDRYPRSKVYRAHLEETRLKNGCSVGANATILGGLTIGEYALIGAGSMVVRDVKPHALIYGNPARQHGWVSHDGTILELGIRGSIELGGYCYDLQGDELRVSRQR